MNKKSTLTPLLQRKPLAQAFFTLSRFSIHNLGRRQFLQLSILILAIAWMRKLSYGQPIPTPLPAIPPSDSPHLTEAPSEVEPITGSNVLGIDLKTYPNPLDDSDVHFQLDKTRLLLAFKAHIISRSEVINLLSGSHLVLEDSPTPPGSIGRPAARKINHTNQRYWIRAEDGTPITQRELNALIQKAQSTQRTLEWVGPVYRIPRTVDHSGLVGVLPHVLRVRLTSTSSTLPLVERLRDRPTDGHTLINLVDIEEIPGVSREARQYVLKPGSQSTAFQLRQKLLDAHPLHYHKIDWSYMPLLDPRGSLPTDPYYTNPPIGPQWNLNRIGAGGSPMVSGWEITKGSSTVTIAIIDHGFDLLHPDLEPNCISPGKTFEDGKAPQDGVDPGTDRHGTCCAGIAGARINNEGIAGLAGLCKILPLKTAAWGFGEVADAIEYATMNSARVISISFGYYPPIGDTVTPAYLEPIEYQISTAATNKDVVICAATLNDDRANGIAYPAADPKVIACGASNRSDERCHPPDWPSGSPGSNYGTGINHTKLWVMAPGVDIPTTTIRGTGLLSANNYIANFWGTSAATPHVAGLAALMLSAAPCLKYHQVKDIIKATARKAGGYGYADPGGWDPQMGYGIIDVRRALVEAQLQCGTGPFDTTPPGSPQNIRIL